MGKYDNIINLPYPPKGRKSNITPEDRAAQFGSFKALSGFDEAIEAENIQIKEDKEDNE